MTRPAVQVYPFQDSVASLPEALRVVGEFGVQGVELAEFAVPLDDHEAAAAALADAGLTVVGTMIPFAERLEAFVAELERCVDLYGPLGCERFVVPRFDATPFDSTAALDAKARRLSTLADAAADRGVDLLYHNHAVEFERLDGTTAFEYLVEATPGGLGFELDLGWAAAGGADPAALVADLGERTPVVHLTDVDADGEPVPMGDGVLDAAACIEAARSAGVEWVVHEPEAGADPGPAVERSLAHARGG
jgi:sugar phosphate isomerase/epimerase